MGFLELVCYALVGMSESLKAGQEQQPILSLRTPEEEAEIARACETWPKYRLERRDGNKDLLVYGDKHFYDQKNGDELVQSLETFKPDAVLVEGAGWEDCIAALQKQGSADEDMILRELGEQAYLVKLAQDRGIPVESWDTSQGRQLREVMARFPLEDVVGWGLFQGAKHLMEQGKLPSQESLMGLIEQVPELAEIVRGQRIDFERLCQRYAHVFLADITPEMAEGLATPRRRGKTNDVIRFMNEMRDRHALQVMAKMKAQHSRVFVGCGGSHAVTWEPALEQMSPEAIE